jgi:tRNA 2-thiouridine synthesizing protein A
MADATLDARGLKCPLPILKARKALNDILPDGKLVVLTTDPGSVADFAAFCRATGHELVEQASGGGEHRFVIRRSS